MIACEHCDGSGIIFDDVARTGRPCVCRPARIAAKRAAALKARIPKAFQGISFDRPPLPSIAQSNPAVVREVRDYVAAIDERLDRGEGIWFTGDFGTGKTTLAMLISQAALNAQRTVAIYSLPRLLELLRSSYRDDSPHSLTGLIDGLTAVDLLHIDDVGTEQKTDWVLEQLYTIVNARYEEKRAMLLTTNLIDLDGPIRLNQQIGYRTVSRLYHICGDPKQMYGTDGRQELRYNPEGS